jgi:hypothetical protein
MKTTNDDCVGIGKMIKDLVEGKRMKANKDNGTYIKEQCQVYLFVQLGLG